MKTIKISLAVLLLMMFLIVAWASASANEPARDLQRYISDIEAEIAPSPQNPINADLEIFRISSDRDSEAIAPGQHVASKRIKGNVTIFSSALVWGENIRLSVDGMEFCSGMGSSANCTIEEIVFPENISPSAIITAINFNTSQITQGKLHNFTVEIFPMPSPEGYIKTSDYIRIRV